MQVEVRCQMLSVTAVLYYLSPQQDLYTLYLLLTCLLGRL